MTSAVVADETTETVLGTLEAVRDFIASNGLRCYGVTVQPPLPVIDGPRLPNVAMQLGPRPGEFMAWCEALNVHTMRLERREHDTLLCATIRRHDIAWEIIGTLTRQRGRDRLPGCGPIWKRLPSGRLGDTGTTGRGSLRAALVALGEVPA